MLRVVGDTVSLAHTVSKSLSVAVAAAFVLYPVLVYTAIGSLGPGGLAAVLAAVCVARLIVLRVHGRPSFGGAYFALACVGGVLLAAMSYWRGSTVGILYYPALVNATLLVVFGVSLVKPPSVVERIARLRDPELPPAAVVYTRRVTMAWTVFFVLNGAAAIYTARFASLETWALYNGLIAYVLIGTLFAIELAIRSVVKRRFTR